MKKYSFLENNKKYFKNYSLVPLRKCDIQNIRRWRNEQIQILRQKIILTKNDQINYYETTIKKSFFESKPNVILFSFLYRKNCIGYGGLVHINWKLKSGEVSFITNTKISKSKNHYQTHFSIFLNLIFKIFSDDLKLNTLTSEVFNIRPWTREILEKSGFEIYDVLKNHVMIENKPVDSILYKKFMI